MTLCGEEENGLIFRADDATALATAMQRVVDEPTLIARWGDASRHQAPDWTPEAGAAKWINAFKSMLG